MDEPDEKSLRIRYEARLLAELKDLAAASEAAAGSRRPVTLDQQSVGRLSRMDAMQGQAMAQAVEVRRAGRERAIAAALDRLENGDFGFCDECGDFIGWKRLDLDPIVMRCVSCAR